MLYELRHHAFTAANESPAAPDNTAVDSKAPAHKNLMCVESRFHVSMPADPYAPSLMNPLRNDEIPRETHVSGRVIDLR